MPHSDDTSLPAVGVLLIDEADYDAVLKVFDDPETFPPAHAQWRKMAEEMAKGALAHAQVDLAVSITGIAGPTGAVPGKPIGLVYFCAASRSGRVIAHDRKFGDIGRSQVRRASLLQALAMLQELAEKEEPRPPAGQS